MKAVVCTRYGPSDVLKIQDVEKPVPEDNEVCVRVVATTVTAGDVRIRGFRVPSYAWLPFRLALGIRRPRKPILGMEFSGVVDEVGSKVSKFKVGERVFGAPEWMKFGAHAEYICLAENGIITHIPDGVTFEDVASVPFMGIGALYFLRKAAVKANQHVLVYGASGAVGTYAVQLAKHFGARVTGVCSTGNMEMIRSLGADVVVDYTRENFWESGVVYDVVFDTVGKSPFGCCVEALSSKGVYVFADRGIIQSVRSAWTSLTSRKTVLGGTAGAAPEDLRFLASLLESGDLKSVIDRIYPLEQIVAAHRYVDTGRKKGNVIITVTGEQVLSN